MALFSKRFFWIRTCYRAYNSSTFLLLLLKLQKNKKPTKKLKNIIFIDKKKWETDIQKLEGKF